MPSSKRNKVVTTSKTRKNRKDLVRRLHANVQEAAAQYNYLWVFDVENMRNTFLKKVRSDLADSRMFMGKTKVMAVALGHTAETETVPGISQIVPHLKGEVGLIFTDRDPKEIESLFEDFVELDYARSGATAAQEFRIPQGQLHTAYGVGGEEDPLPIAIEPQLRKLGVPTRIVKGKVTLEESAPDNMADEEGYLVCKEGDVLDSRQTSILKIFGVRMAEFRMSLKAVFDKQNETVREVGGMDVETS